jgi:Phage tail lysozyme
MPPFHWVTSPVPFQFAVLFGEYARRTCSTLSVDGSTPTPRAIPRASTWANASETERMAYVMRVLVENYHFPRNGAAGLVGNLYAESGLIPDRVEGSRDIHHPMRALDFNDRTVDFTPEQVMNRSRRQRIGPKRPGIGLAQWTSSNRRNAFFQQPLGVNIVYGMDAQLQFLVAELQGSYGNVYRVLTNPHTSIHEACDIVLTRFEVPGVVVHRAENVTAYERTLHRRRVLADRAAAAYSLP